jgi:DNA-binding transcriptional MocR family regulator
VLVEPGDVFFLATPPARRAFRLGYASIEPKSIEGGIRLLAEVIAEMQRVTQPMSAR